MASAWPDLTSLTLEAFISSTNPERLDTIHCLALIAKQCPKLEKLFISIEDADLPSVDALPLLSHPLKILELDCPEMKDPLQLAFLLDRIFPSLTEVSVRETEDTVLDMSVWAELPGHIRILQANRAVTKSSVWN